MRTTLTLICIFIATYAFSSSSGLRADKKSNLKKVISEKVKQQLTEELQDYEARRLTGDVPPSSERISDYLQYNRSFALKFLSAP